MLEKNIEKALVAKIKNDFGGMCEKFASPAKRSVPDRLITLPGGKVIFAEIKAPGKKPTEAQAIDHAKRRAMGCDVRVIDSMESVRDFKL